MSEKNPNKSRAKPLRFARRREPFSIRRFTNQKKKPNECASQHDVGTLGRMKCRALALAPRPVASERRPRASERRRPTSLLHSLFDFDRKNEEVRFRDRFRVRIHPRFVHTGRSRSTHFHSIPTASRPGTPPRFASHRIAGWNRGEKTHRLGRLIPTRGSTSRVATRGSIG